MRIKRELNANLNASILKQLLFKQIEGDDEGAKDD